MVAGSQRRAWAVVLLTRAPEPGKTKTRMMPDLTPDQCAQLHVALLQDVGAACCALSRTCDVLVAFLPEGDVSAVKAALGAPATYFIQQGDTLKARLQAALEEAFCRGYERCVLIGADAPEIDADEVLRAFRLLDEVDVVLGPASDGGFYLIGMSDCHTDVFCLSEYGHDAVFEQTVEHINETGLTCAYVKPCDDVDDWRAAEALLMRAETDPRTAATRTARFLSAVKRSKDGRAAGRC